MARYNPFRPGNIVAPGMFCGRLPETIALERALFQAKHGNPTHFLVHGERGIGKSSLFWYLQQVAKGRIADPADQTKFGFLTVSVDLEPTTTYVDLIQKIGADFARVVGEHQKVKELARKGWEFLARWEVAGVRYDRGKEPEPHQLLEELVHTVQTSLDSLKGSTDGLVVFIDEADKPSADCHLGEFVKLFTERLTKRGCEHVCLGLAGQTELIAKLKASHESSPRIFQLYTLEPLSMEERVQVIESGLEEVKKKTGDDVTVDGEAQALIATLSEGYPHFVQQFAYSAFECDTDDRITELDVRSGAFGENGALHQLGLKYFSELYFDQISSDHYRNVLALMADRGTDWVTKEEIRKGIKIKESTLTNAITALKNRKIIIPMKGNKAVYRLPTNAFAVWIKAVTAEAGEQLPFPPMEE